MKKIILLFILLFTIQVHGQVVNQITILPTNPSSTDTLYVITNFSYYGNCAFSLVGYYYYLQDSTIHILPTYCGYGDTTWCTSIDTLKLETFPSNNYNISIEFHQGSSCPFSHFDATIAQFDTSLTISTSSGLEPINNSDDGISVFPNPTNGIVNVQLVQKQVESISLYNAFGKLIDEFYTSTFSIANLSTGMYWINVKADDKIYSRKIIKN